MNLRQTLIESVALERTVAPRRYGDDFCSFAGATAIACQISDYWRARGFDVTPRIIFSPAIRNIAPRADVRSDMVDGLPRKRITQ